MEFLDNSPDWLVVVIATLAAAVGVWLLIKLLKLALWLLFYGVIFVGGIAAIWLLFQPARH